MEDYNCKTRQEAKGKDTQYKEVYNQKTVRQWETMRENRELKRKAAIEKSTKKDEQIPTKGVAKSKGHGRKG